MTLLLFMFFWCCFLLQATDRMGSWTTFRFWGNESPELLSAFVLREASRNLPWTLSELFSKYIDILTADAKRLPLSAEPITNINIDTSHFTQPKRKLSRRRWSFQQTTPKTVAIKVYKRLQSISWQSKRPLILYRRRRSCMLITYHGESDQVFWTLFHRVDFVDSVQHGMGPGSSFAKSLQSRRRYSILSRNCTLYAVVSGIFTRRCIMSAPMSFKHSLSTQVHSCRMSAITTCVMFQPLRSSYWFHGRALGTKSLFLTSASTFWLS